MERQINERTMRNSPIESDMLRGVYTALITPMLSGNGLSNPIDYEKLYKLIDDQARAGVNGVVVCGTTGQASTLSMKEHAELAKKSFNYIKTNHPNLQFIVGSGSNCTREAISLSFEIEEAIGPATFLHVTGYYNNPTQEGIIEHYERLASCLPKSNIILYNVPGRTGSCIELETVVHLSNVKNIIGIKIATGDECLSDAQRIVYETDPEKFVVLSGEDRFVSRVIQSGGKGVISATANIAPKYFVRMANAALEGNHEQAQQLQERIRGFIENFVFCDTNPIPLAHLFDTEVRLPLMKTAYLEDLLRYRLDPNNFLPEYNFSSEELGVDLKNYRNGKK